MASNASVSSFSTSKYETYSFFTLKLRVHADSNRTAVLNGFEKFSVRFYTRHPKFVCVEHFLAALIGEEKQLFLGQPYKAEKIGKINDAGRVAIGPVGLQFDFPHKRRILCDTMRSMGANR